MDPQIDRFKDLNWAELSVPEKRDVWLQISDMTALEFDSMMAEQKRR